MILKVLVCCIALLSSAAHAEARVPLSKDATLENGLVIVAIGNVLRKNCKDITPRYFRAFSFARELELRAQQLGYSDAEIDAYLDSDADKIRVKGKALAWFKAKGASMDDITSLCAVGRAEIASQTTLGTLLRKR